eukprot:NODE_307_length_1500_cov_346.634045_g221_i0.p1 GENE.NODE_307_length_1500_cov_346.634045_g221_i0~~NODE_307_length_1500_cov_346.634045_g221_i0.p1  ORF type:complete len:461 (-),score=82.98 NODE_307_length_1500_cov_346.634045_g221_i0:59-1441(-)
MRAMKCASMVCLAVGVLWTILLLPVPLPFPWRTAPKKQRLPSEHSTAESVVSPLASAGLTSASIPLPDGPRAQTPTSLASSASSSTPTGPGMAVLRDLLTRRLNCSHDRQGWTCWRDGLRMFPLSKLTLAEFWSGQLSTLFAAKDAVHSAAFVEVADVKCTCESCRVGPHNLFEGAVIYLDPKCIEALPPKLARISHGFFLVTHQRDENICWQCHRAAWDRETARPHAAREQACCTLLNHPRLRRWYAINVRSEHPKLFRIPLGVHPKVIVPLHAMRQATRPLPPPTTSLFVNFQVLNRFACKGLKALYWHCRRGNVMDGMKAAGNDVPPRGQVSSKLTIDGYLAAMLQARFVLSPRGNGLDLYRSWEALSLGRVPMIEETGIDPVFRGLPIVIVNDTKLWSTFSPTVLDHLWADLEATRFDWQKLWMPYWWVTMLDDMERQQAAAAVAGSEGHAVAAPD